MLQRLEPAPRLAALAAEHFEHLAARTLDFNRPLADVAALANLQYHPRP